MDWKSSLESLKASMPGEETPESAEVDGAADAALRDSADTVEKARLDILLDRKGRKGKQATIIAGFTVGDGAVDDIARRLKQRLGVGGASRGGEILIQGDKRREVEQALRQMNIKCRVI